MGAPLDMYGFMLVSFFSSLLRHGWELPWRLTPCGGVDHKIIELMLRSMQV